MVINALISIILVVFILSVIVNIALSPIRHYAPWLMRFSRSVGQGMQNKLLIEPFQRRGAAFFVLVWLPLVATVALIGRFVMTGEQLSTILFMLILTLVAFLVWRTFTRARQQQYRLPGRKRKRRR